MKKSPPASPAQPHSENKSINIQKILTNNGEPQPIVVKITLCNSENAVISSVVKQGNNSADKKETVCNTIKTPQTQQHVVRIVDNVSICSSNARGFCRICHSCGEEPLISPCRCIGSAQFIHSSCLITWLKKSMRETCELCRYRFHIKKELKRRSEWQFLEDKPFPITWCIIFSVGIIINTLAITFHASDECISPVCVMFYISNGIGAIVNVLFLMSWVPSCMLYCNKWVAINQEWIVLDKPSDEQSGNDGDDNDKSNEKNCNNTEYESTI